MFKWVGGMLNIRISTRKRQQAGEPAFIPPCFRGRTDSRTDFDRPGRYSIRWIWMNDRFDVIVVGGGPAGSIAALSIVRAGYSVALLEKQSFPRETLCGDLLSGDVVAAIHQLG